jgi:iron complex outermembrane recepter protein
MKMNKRAALWVNTVASIGFSFGLLGEALAAGETDAGSTADATSLQEIVVTAQHRAENLQQVPIAITAINGNQLAAEGITDTTALGGAVPGLNFIGGEVAVPFIRGVGSSSGDPSNEPSAAMYIDGVYIAAPDAILFDFNYVDSIDVLKGPQGTLFGRNATAGVIQVQTRDPSFTPGWEGQVGYANYNTRTASAYGTAGLTDTLAVNASFGYRDQGDGYGHNLLTGSDVYWHGDEQGRVKLLFKPGDATRVLAQADFTDYYGVTDDFQVRNGELLRDGTISNLRPFNTINGYPSRQETESRGTSLTIDQDFGLLTLKSISSWRKMTGVEHDDIDTTPGAYFNANLPRYQENYSQEFHLGSPADSKIKWLVGLYWIRTAAAIRPYDLSGIDLGNVELIVDNLIRTRSGSAFAQATLPVTSNTNITAGIRYTHERQDYDNAQTIVFPVTIPLVPYGEAHQEFNKPTWRLAVDHQLTSDILAYVSYNRGIKSGGYSGLNPATLPGYQPEQLDSYEVGLKSEWFNRRLRLNAAAYYYNYKDIQVEVIEGGATQTQNAAGARIRGVDLDFEALPIEQLSVSGGLSYEDGYYSSFPQALSYPGGFAAASIVDATGKSTILTPRWSGNLSVAYHIPLNSGTVSPSATVIYTDSFFWAADNLLPSISYAIVNARLRWQSDNDRFHVDLWGKNLNNKIYLAAVLPSSYGNLETFADPRTFGVNFGVKF